MDKNRFTRIQVQNLNKLRINVSYRNWNTFFCIKIKKKIFFLLLSFTKLILSLAWDNQLLIEKTGKTSRVQILNDTVCISVMYLRKKKVTEREAETVLKELITPRGNN